MSLLETQDVTKAFGGVVAVDHVSIVVEEGTVLGLIGPNGAGKSSLVNLISGFYRPDAGTIRFDGVDMTAARTNVLARAGVARTFQNIRLFDGISALGNVLLGRHMRCNAKLWRLAQRRSEDRAQRARCLELLETVGLGGKADIDVSGFSYGDRRRVEIARALATEPQLLLLDEPTAGMTREESDRIGDLVTQLASNGLAVMLIDHNVRLVTNTAHSISVLDRGRMVVTGTPSEIWNNEHVKRAYLGTAT